MVCHRPSHPVQDTLPAHHRAFAPVWQRSASEAEEKAVRHRDPVEEQYNKRAHALPEIHVGSHVAVQNSITKRWDIYGIVADVGPHRRFYVRTNSGRVLVRNRRFLRRRVPLSLPGAMPLPPGTPGTPPAPRPTAHVPLRRSSRLHFRPKRLIEEITFK